MKAEKQQLYDSYGFRTNAATLAVENYLNDPERVQERIDFWQDIIKKDIDFKEAKQLLRVEVRKGVPDQLRPQVWMQLITPPLKQYEKIIVKQQLKQIDRDVNRTIPTNKREGQLKERLRRMLNILAAAFPEMGYCQGLNFITANLLLILDDKQTYSVMFHILYWQGHEKLMSDLNRIHKKLYTLNKLVRKHYPKLSKCLEKMEIDPLLYASSWFITLFNNSLPCQYVFRIMQIYFVEGDKILYRVALQILKQKKKFIKTMATPEEIIAEIKNNEDFDTGKIDHFFREMFEINISRRQIEMYENEYEELKKQY